MHLLNNTLCYAVHLVWGEKWRKSTAQREGSCSSKKGCSDAPACRFRLATMAHSWIRKTTFTWAIFHVNLAQFQKETDPFKAPKRSNVRKWIFAKVLPLTDIMEAPMRWNIFRNNQCFQTPSASRSSGNCRCNCCCIFWTRSQHSVDPLLPLKTLTCAESSDAITAVVFVGSKSSGTPAGGETKGQFWEDAQHPKASCHGNTGHEPIWGFTSSAVHDGRGAREKRQLPKCYIHLSTRPDVNQEGADF